MYRTTSAESIRELRDSGKLPAKYQGIVYIMSMCKPMTARALDNQMDGAHKRLSEMKTLGIVQECGFVIDDKTNKRAILWGLSNQNPFFKVETVKHKSRAELEAENITLRIELEKLKGIYNVFSI